MTARTAIPRLARAALICSVGTSMTKPSHRPSPSPSSRRFGIVSSLAVPYSSSSCSGDVLDPDLLDAFERVA
jgi:hypothetical protein